MPGGGDGVIPPVGSQIARRPVLRFPLLSAAVCVVIVALWFAATASADIYRPTRADDPGTPYICAPTDCSLRDAVIAANANPGFDFIELRGTTYSLQIRATQTDTERSGDLDVT